MLITKFLRRHQYLSFDDIRTLQFIVLQVTQSLECFSEISKKERYSLIEEQVNVILEDLDLKVPDSLLNTGIKASLATLEEERIREILL